jgi:uncharacterized protein YecT (DUF1311 family)
MNWRVERLFPRCAALLISLFVPAAHIQGQTQAAMNAQARADFARADADLNKTYQAILAKLRDAASKQELREKERAWLASRDAEAARAAKQADGGSMAPTIRYETMAELTEQRIKELKKRLAEKATSGEEGTATPSPSPSPEPQKSAETNTATELTAEPSSDESPGQEDNENETCDCPPSPDGKFAFLTSDTEKNSSGDQLQIIDLIDKDSGKKLQRIDEAEVPISWNVLWAPDSNGFALKTKVVGHPRLEGSDAYFRSGEIFRKIKLPESDAYYTSVVWAPDLKRFAFNLHSNTGEPNATVAFYQLRNDKWIALQSPAGEASKHTQLAQLARKYSPKNAYRKGDSSPASDSLEARSWTDANTVILYAHSEGNEGEAGALFTLKFDEAGNWKIIKMHQMSKEEIDAAE